jgi:hypothetical protein
MSSKSALAICVAALTAVILAFLKETYWAALVDTVFDTTAHLFGVERAKMMATAAPFVIAITAAWVIIMVTYQLGMRDRTLKPEFDFIYDAHDPRFVKAEKHKTTYFVGLKIKARRTIDAPSVLAADNPFTERVIHGRGAPSGPSGYFFVYRGGALDPDVTETVELFDLPFFENLPKERTDILRQVQTFTLEARGRDARPVTAVFEYNPRETPMIRKLPGPRWWQLWS